jgi:hypothetical protein
LVVKHELLQSSPVAPEWVPWSQVRREQRLVRVVPVSTPSIVALPSDIFEVAHEPQELC